MGDEIKQPRARHVIVIAGASSSGKTHLIGKLISPLHDAFTAKLLEHLDCKADRRLERSTLKRMQRLIDPDSTKKSKTKKLKRTLLVHVDITSINYKASLKRLHQISQYTDRVDVITLYADPAVWRRRITERIHTSNEPSMRAGLIAISATINESISNFFYHREYKKWLKEMEKLRTTKTCIANTLEKRIITSFPQE